MMSPAMVTLTENAANRMKQLIENSDEPVQALRVGVRTKGCSGMSYHFEYAREKRPNEDEIEDKGVRIFLEPASVMFLFGSQIDYQEGRLESGFVFNNPNEKGRCGCGESFTI